ncbi:MAG: hypothetical protein M1828_007246 [Chrysothrix sp. TS-e1954]|nr:MAG: hypothetical protein M1828_007246 [Chrysothrix sp. TS-e1954]
MAPPRFSLPAPKTEAARVSLQSFYCDLCQKGYSRQNEFAAHEASYEHNHNQRRKDLKGMNQAMSGATAKARSKEEKEGGIVKLSSTDAKEKPTAAAGGGFRKGGFKSAFGAKQDPVSSSEAKPVTGGLTPDQQPAEARPDAAITDGEACDSEDDYELYNPRKPTGCGSSCTRLQEAVSQHD